MLLADYSGRLAAEIDDRRQLTRTLATFLQSQKDGLVQNEQKLEVRKSHFCFVQTNIVSYLSSISKLLLPSNFYLLNDNLCTIRLFVFYLTLN